MTDTHPPALRLAKPAAEGDARTRGLALLAEAYRCTDAARVLLEPTASMETYAAIDAAEGAIKAAALAAEAGGEGGP